MNLSGVYAIIHRPSGRAYIGSSQNIVTRWRWHLRALQQARHHCIPLLDAWLLDGPGAFAFVVLDFCDRNALITCEQEWLGYFAEVFNTGLIVDAPMRGRHHNDDVRQRISATMRDRGIQPVTAGTPHTDETRTKMSVTRMGHVTDDATRRKIGEANKKAWAMKSPEARRRSLGSCAKTSATLRHKYAHDRWNLTRTVEQRARISATLRGHVHHTSDTCATISANTRAALAKPEVKAKLSDARRTSWATRRKDT